MRRSVSDSSVSRTLDLPPAERAATRATERATETGAAARAEAGEIATGIGGWCCRADGRADVSESGVQLRAEVGESAGKRRASVSRSWAANARVHLPGSIVIVAVAVPAIRAVVPVEQRVGGVGIQPSRIADLRIGRM